MVLKYYSKNDFKNALKHFEAYNRKREQEGCRCFLHDGRMLSNEDKIGKAAECFAKADAIKPDDFDIVTQLAKCLLTLKIMQGH